MEKEVTETVEISEDLKNMVSTTIESIKEGLKTEKCRVSGAIKFEVSVAESKEAKTGLKILVGCMRKLYQRQYFKNIL